MNTHCEWVFNKQDTARCLPTLMRPYFVGRSKNGLFDEAEMAMPTVIWMSSPRKPSSSAATPIEYMMRVSRRRSAAVAHADPRAMPTSMLFITQGTSRVES